MTSPTATALLAWQSFYVIVGSSAAALTGLSFVVVSLVAQRRSAQSANAIAAFGTPTVVHLCAAFFVAAVLAAPWSSLTPAADVVGVSGILGVLYVFIVLLRTRRQSLYRPVLEDWIWHVIIPLAAYLTFAIGGLACGDIGATPQFAIAAGTVLLIFCGVHNSWDSVTYSLSLPHARPDEHKPPAEPHD
jgi:hypothetical protein